MDLIPSRKLSVEVPDCLFINALQISHETQNIINICSCYRQITLFSILVLWNVIHDRWIEAAYLISKALWYHIPIVIVTQPLKEHIMDHLYSMFQQNLNDTTRTILLCLFLNLQNQLERKNKKNKKMIIIIRFDVIAQEGCKIKYH